MKLSPSMRVLLFEAAAGPGRCAVVQGPEVLTARALRRRGLMTDLGPAPSGIGRSFGLTNAGQRAVDFLQDPGAAGQDPPEDDVAAYARGQ